jgi:hypothetical protein
MKGGKPAHLYTIPPAQGVSFATHRFMAGKG